MENVKNVKDVIFNIKQNEKGFHDIRIEDFAPEGKWASIVAEDLGEKMKTAQLRKVFHELKRIQKGQKGKKDEDRFDDPSIYLLIPQLAYARARKLVTPSFYDLMTAVIGNGGTTTKLKQVRDYERFVQFITAIVAFQKK